MTLYALRSLTVKDFQIAKLSDDMNVEATYNLVKANGFGYRCDCPASYKLKLKPCKHQRMLPLLMGAVNLPRFYNPDTGAWISLLEAAPGLKIEHEEGEAKMQGEDRTATQIVEDTKALPSPDPAAILEPMIDKIASIAEKLNEPRPQADLSNFKRRV